MLLTNSFAPQLTSQLQSYGPIVPSLGTGAPFLWALQQQLLSAMNAMMGSLFAGGTGSQMSSSGLSGLASAAPTFGASGGVRPAGGSGIDGFLGGPARSFGGPAAQAAHGAKGTAANPRNSQDNKFKTLNVNVRSLPLMSQDKVVHDVRKAASQADLIGWNEISPGRYFKAIKDLGPGWGHYMPKDGKLRIPNPISYRKAEWKMLDKGFKKTHGGLAKTSPNRYITWARLQHKGSGEEVVRINTHLVSGAFSPKKQSNRGWRKKNWAKHIKQLTQLVDRFESQGLKVVVGGDFNRNHYKVLGNKVRYDSGINKGTIGRSTLDYLMSVPNSGLKNLSGGVHKGYASDHNAVYGSYSLTGS